MEKKAVKAKLSEVRKKEGKAAYISFDSNITKDIKVKGPQPEIEYIRDLLNVASGPKRRTRHSLIIELLEGYIEKNDLLK